MAEKKELTKEQISTLSKFIFTFDSDVVEVAGDYIKMKYNWDGYTLQSNLDIVSKILLVEQYQVMNN
jgi:hypothetical protein